MSSFKNASKTNQKVHRERSQPKDRAHLGLLPKKKDYKLRADEYHRKQTALKVLKKKALDRNPDEFYFNMVRTRLEDGEHQSEDLTPTYTDDQLKLMQSQDRKYVDYKRSTELKKIEKLKASLHLLDSKNKPKNKHTIFVDCKKEVKNFDPAKYLDTHPALLDRRYNRPRLDTLKTAQFQGQLDPESMAEAAVERSKQYKELGRRIDREKELHIIAQKMDMKTHLMKKQAKKRKVADETVEHAAVYKWQPVRQR